MPFLWMGPEVARRCLDISLVLLVAVSYLYSLLLYPQWAIQLAGLSTHICSSWILWQTISKTQTCLSNLLKVWVAIWRTALLNYLNPLPDTSVGQEWCLGCWRFSKIGSFQRDHKFLQDRTEQWMNFKVVSACGCALHETIQMSCMGLLPCRKLRA